MSIDWAQLKTAEQKAQEAYEASIPKSITPRQARLALLNAGLLSHVEAAITAMAEPAKTAVQIEWEYAVSVERNSNWVANLGAALGLSDEQLDQLFIQAATL